MPLVPAQFRSIAPPSVVTSHASRISGPSLRDRGDVATIAKRWSSRTGATTLSGGDDLRLERYARSARKRVKPCRLGKNEARRSGPHRPSESRFSVQSIPPRRFNAGRSIPRPARAARVDRPERLDDRAGIDRDGPREAVVVDEVEDERMDVAVEDQADDLVLAVDDRAPRVAADDVGRRDEVQRRVEPEPALVPGLDPARRQLVGRRVAVRLGVLEGAADRGEGGDELAVELVTLDGPEGEAERERRVGIGGVARARRRWPWRSRRTGRSGRPRPRPRTSCGGRGRRRRRPGRSLIIGSSAGLDRRQSLPRRASCGPRRRRAWCR